MSKEPRLATSFHLEAGDEFLVSGQAFPTIGPVGAQAAQHAFYCVMAGPLPMYFREGTEGQVRKLVEELVRAERWLRDLAGEKGMMAQRTLPLPIQYLCPGAPEDGGEHLWWLEGEEEEEQMSPAGARVWCPDHDENRAMRTSTSEGRPDASN